jgi:hypothetical protein
MEPGKSSGAIGRLFAAVALALLAAQPARAQTVVINDEFEGVKARRP